MVRILDLFRPFKNSLKLRQIFLSFLRLSVNPGVEHNHDGDGDVEGNGTRDHHHVDVGREELDEALGVPGLPLALDVRPGEYPRRPDDAGDEPGAGDHDAGTARGAVGAVGQRSSHAEVTVEADDDEVGHGGVAHGVVQRQPGVAQERAQRPVVQQDVDLAGTNRDGFKRLVHGICYCDLRFQILQM